jgi:starch synthase (maltosyl-transferring)
LEKKVNAGLNVSVDLPGGAELVAETAQRAARAHVLALQGCASRLRSEKELLSARIDLALSEDVSRLMSLYGDRSFAAEYGKELSVVVDRQRARFSTWYEMFPRSCSTEPGRHGTFKDCEARLPYIASIGFDVLYLPPIHPIGLSQRKGQNNSPIALPADPGSPWGIGAPEGGHKGVHPQLGTLEDFRDLLTKAGEYGIEVALDLAFHCSPDHPYAAEHPEWFRHRPDGTVQYAENPPKRYEDIYPFDFGCDSWPALWEELKGVFLFWIEQGVRIFRVDNPHTKSFAFWEWVIGEVKRSYPDVIFLAEAFTRPNLMYRLAKLGFTQSYTYFTWRNAKWELTQYFTELAESGVREFFRPNLWPNTPDILTEYLQTGGHLAFMVRLALAATLGASYGIYGPAFELAENRPQEPGSEEYLDSEKYQIRQWDLERPDSLRGFIARVNQIRQSNPCLQSDWSLRFHPVDNDQIICYSKRTADGSNVVLVFVNLDPHNTHSGWVELALQELGLDPEESYQVHDLLSDARYTWQGSKNYVELNPQMAPAHIFAVRHRTSSVSSKK